MDQPHLPALYAGAVIAVLASAIASLLKLNAIGKPARSFLLFATLPGVLRLIVCCAILAGVLVRTEGVALHLAVGMLCGSLTSIAAEVMLLAGMDATARTATPGRE
jgi:endonuclease/exonuclease/phosphatase (EEP) superfamily protein YafD